MSLDSVYKDNDFRNSVPRFDLENRKSNQLLVDLVNDIAVQKQVTPAQIALAWILAQKNWIVPFPGTTKLERLDENIGSVSVELTPADLQLIEEAASKIALQGDRYQAAAQKMINR